MAERIGNVWYTEDAEYGIRKSQDAWQVFRGDGSTIDCSFDESEAEEIAESLANGERTDDEYDWLD